MWQDTFPLIGWDCGMWSLGVKLCRVKGVPTSTVATVPTLFRVRPNMLRTGMTKNTLESHLQINISIFFD